MAYLEVKKDGRVIVRRRLDDAEAERGCSVNLGPDKTVKLSTGQIAREGDYEARIMADDERTIATDEDVTDVTVEADADAPDSFQAQACRTLDPDTGAPTIEGYEIKRLLGQGAMGQVWHAVQLSTHREVALKFMSRGRFASEKSRLRFEREVELAARLEHPNIARVYDSGLHHGGYFYAMELISGRELDRYVEDSGLSQREILDLMHTVCRAVQHAHQRGVIHRDLKPGNIMVCEGEQGENKPFVVDFGLAKALLEDEGEEESQLNISQDGESTGTPAYMSPEQAAGRLDEIDVRTDVYSLGVILYRLLTGEAPHELTGSRFDFLRRVVEDEVRRPREVCKCIDAELEALLLKALAHDPADRYASAGDLADDITNYLTGEPLTARKATTAYFLKKRIRKHRTAVMIAAVVLLTLMSTAAWSYVKVRNERAEAIRQRKIADVERGRAVAFAAELKAKQDEVIRERNRALQAKAKAEREEKKAKLAETRTRRALYANRIARAEAELRQFNVPAARDVLNQCDPQLRRWEWYRLVRLLDQSVRRLEGFDKGTAAVAFGPGGGNMAAVSFDGIIKTWNPLTGRPGGSVRTSARQVVAAAFSDDAKRLVISGVASGASIWDVFAGRKIADLQPTGGATVFCAAVSPRGQLAATGGYGARVDLWDANAGGFLRSLATGGADATAVAFDAAATSVAAGCRDGRILVWTVQTGRLLAAWSHGSEVTVLAFSGDGGRLVSGGADGRLKLWRLGGAAAVRTLGGHTGRISAVAFSRDGKRIISAGSDRTLRIWDARTAALLASLTGHGAGVSALAVSDDDKWIVSGATDKPLRIWDAAGGYATTTIATGAAVRTVACGPAGTLIASVGQGKNAALRVWDAATGRGAGAGGIRSAADDGAVFLPDGKRLAVAGRDGTVRIIDALTGRTLQSLSGHAGPVRCVAAGGKWIASAGSDGTVRIWGAAASEAKWTFRADADCVAVSADGKLLAAGGRDRTVHLWNIQTGRAVADLTGHAGQVTAVAFSADSRTVISGSWDRTIKLWNAADHKLLKTLSGHTRPVLALAVSGDGLRIVSASADRTLKIWNTVTGAAMLTLDGHQGQVTSVAITADGRKIVSGSLDQSVRIWDSAVQKRP